MSLNESEKRDFCRRMLKILDDNSERLTALGFNPANMATALGTLADTADDKETDQAQARKFSLNTTAASVSSTEAAYKRASEMAEVVIGLVGRDDQLTREIRQIRTNERSNAEPGNE